jgi:hypothetical protein
MQKSKNNTISTRVGTFVSYLIVVAILVIFFVLYNFAVSHFTVGHSLSDYKPVLSDAVVYYLEIQTAVERGLLNANAGYFGYFQDSAYVAELLNYGAHGIMYIFPYLIIGNIIGWNPNTPVAADIIFLFLAITVLHFGANNLKKTILCVGCTLSFPLILYYFGTGMLEVMLSALLIVLTVLLYRYCANPTSQRFFVALIAVVVCCSFRIHNIIFLIPLIAYPIPDKSQRFHRVCLLCGFALTGFMYMIWGKFSSGYPGGFLNELFSVIRVEGSGAGIRLFLSHFILNTKNYLNIFDGNALFVFLRYAIIVMIAVLLLNAFYRVEAFVASGKTERRRSADRYALSFAAALAASVLLIISFYDVFDWRDFRSLSPILLSVILAMVLNIRPQKIPAMAGAVICALSLSFSSIIPTVMLQTADTDWPMFPKIAEKVQYDENAKSRWENTILVNVNIPIVLSEPGIGTIYSFDAVPDEQSLRAKYVLLNTEANYSQYAQIATEGDYRLYERIEED